MDASMTGSEIPGQIWDRLAELEAVTAGQRRRIIELEGRASRLEKAIRPLIEAVDLLGRHAKLRR